MSVRFNSSDSVPFGTTCDFDVFLNAASVEVVGEREVGVKKNTRLGFDLVTLVLLFFVYS